jgi:hypothetical protein
VTATGINRLATSGDGLVLNGVTLNAPTTVNGAVRVAAGESLAGTADIKMATTTALVGTTSGTFTIGSNLDVHGRGTVGGAVTGLSPLVNHGHVSADVAGAVLLVRGDGITNDGTFEVKNNAVLSFGGTFTTAGLGTIVNNGGTLLIAGNLQNAGQTLTVNSVSNWRMGQGGRITGGVITTAPGQKLVVDATTSGFNGVTLDGVTLDGAVVQLLPPTATYSWLNLDNGIDGTGTILLGGNSAFGNGIHNFKNNSLHPVVIGADISVRGGSGQIDHLDNRGIVHAEPGTIVELVLTASSNLARTTNAGTLKVSSGGRMTAARLTFADGGTLEVDLVSGATQAPLSIAGPLDLSNSNDYLSLIPPASATTSTEAFLIATYTGTLTGAFDHVTPGYVVDYSQAGKIFVSVPEPSSLVLLVAGAALTLRRRSRIRS